MPTKVTKKQLRAALLEAVEHYDRTSQVNDLSNWYGYLCIFLNDALGDREGITLADRLWERVIGEDAGRHTVNSQMNRLFDLSEPYRNRSLAVARQRLWLACLYLAWLDAGDLDHLLT